MSDREAFGSAVDDELSLPKATVSKMISGESQSTSRTGVYAERLGSTELLPNDISCAKETRDLVIECCKANSDLEEFIHLIASEANDVCEEESKKTIAPEHIISALKRLGFDAFTSDVEDVLKDHKAQQKDRDKKVSKLEQSGLTEEELLAKQEELFAASRAKFQNAQQ